ncbi:MAG: 3-oxoacyl-[acyl-carrier-protein] synthase III C-terminal domain-containing protein [Candidatus Nanoarchaeia archaeon]
MGVIISQPGIYLSPDTLFNFDLEKMVETSDEWIYTRTGISERKISLDKGVIGMGIEAAKDLEKKLGLKFMNERINAVYVALNKHDDGKSIPAHASEIAKALGINNAWYSDTIAGCPGLVGAIISARNDIISGEADKILVLGGDRLSGMTDYSDRNTCILFGDAMVAYYVKRSKYDGILGVFRGGEVDAGDVNSPEWNNGFLTQKKKEGKSISKDESGNFILRPEIKQYMVMEGKQIFKFAVDVLPRAIEKALKNANLKFEDLDYVIPHNANKRIIEYIEPKLKELGFRGRALEIIKVTGNTSGASTGLSESYFIEQGVLKDGQIVAVASMGAGKNYAAIVKINTYDASYFV